MLRGRVGLSVAAVYKESFVREVVYVWKRFITMISTLHTADVTETTSRQTGVAKKEPKCIIDYNTHMHGVDTADQYVLLSIHSLICQVA